MLLQLPLDFRNQLLALFVHFILGIEQGTPFLVSLSFYSLDLFLARKLFFQSERSCCSPAGFFDLSVEFFDLPLQAKLQVVSPAVEFVSLGIKEACIALGNIALDGRLALLCERMDLLPPLANQDGTALLSEAGSHRSCIISAPSCRSGMWPKIC